MVFQLTKKMNPSAQIVFKLQSAPVVNKSSPRSLQSFLKTQTTFKLLLNWSWHWSAAATERFASETCHKNHRRRKKADGFVCFLHHHHRIFIVFLESQNVKLLVQCAVLTLVVVVLDDCLNEAINSEVRTSQQTVCVVGSVRGKIRGVSQCLSVNEARQVRSEVGRQTEWRTQWTDGQRGVQDLCATRLPSPSFAFLLVLGQRRPCCHCHCWDPAVWRVSRLH